MPDPILTLWLCFLAAAYVVWLVRSRRPRPKAPTPEEIEAERRRRAEERLAQFWHKPGDRDE